MSRRNADLRTGCALRARVRVRWSDLLGAATSGWHDRRVARSRSGSPRQVAVAPATLAPVVLPDLVPADRDVLDAVQPLEALVFDAVDLSGLVHDDAELLDCRLTGCRLDGTRLRRGRLLTCVLSELHATTLDVADSSWRDVLVSDCRIGALTAHGLQLRSVTVRGGKLDFVNLRGADLDRVRFEGCRIGELDLGSAHVHDVRLDATEVDRLVFGGASCTDVHLEQGVVGVVEGVPGLRGVTVSRSQLDALAPALAAHVGLAVAAD